MLLSENKFKNVRRENVIIITDCNVNHVIENVYVGKLLEGCTFPCFRFCSLWSEMMEPSFNIFLEFGYNSIGHIQTLIKLSIPFYIWPIETLHGTHFLQRALIYSPILVL